MNRVIRQWAIGAILLGTACSSPSEQSMAPLPAIDSALVGPDWSGDPRTEAGVFLSGHSLMDRPLPDQLAEIAQSLSTPMQWNRQYMVGSSIKDRVDGPPGSAESSGYRLGDNREGANLDAASELAEPRTIDPPRYDVLLLTEQHSLLGTLVWNDSLKYLRAYHDRFIAGNPVGVTYFYESWLDLDSKTDPSRWIAYEREASVIWQCLATRINSDLEIAGRTDRIVSLPAGLALASLLDTALSREGLEALSRASSRETVELLLADNVHLTELGSYFQALVVYSSVYRRSAVGAWRPPGISPQQARSLQEFAWSFVDDYYRNYRPLSVAACRQLVREQFNATYWAYIRDVLLRPESGTVRAYVSWARSRYRWSRIFAEDSPENPFFMATTATDR